MSRSKNDIPRTTEGNNVPENSLRESRFLTFNNDRSNIRVRYIHHKSFTFSLVNAYIWRILLAKHDTGGSSICNTNPRNSNRWKRSYRSSQQFRFSYNWCEFKINNLHYCNFRTTILHNTKTGTNLPSIQTDITSQ